jgi:hypothetical protein
MLFKHKSTIKVDMADLEEEKTNLAQFLQNQYKINSTTTHKGLELIMEQDQLITAVMMVKKFIYHKNLNATHWVNAENNTVKINKFKNTNKKKEKHEKTSPHQNITQSWGL